MPNPELEETASEPPEISASGPETSVPEAVAPAAALGAAASESAARAATRAGKRQRRSRLAAAATLVGAILVVGGGGTVAVLAAHGFDSPAEPDLKLVAPAYRDMAGSLPWPNDGETALWAQGIGSLGTCGDQTPVPIASVAKVMTAYVLLKDHPLADGQNGPDITVDRQAEDESYDRDESSAPVRAGQRLSERAMLELMLVPSANNVARLLARWDAGTEDAFVAEMNAAAAALGMTHTTYTDPSGLDAATRSTATDQLLLAESALTDPTLLALTGVPDTEVPDDPTVLANTDTLLGADGVVGGKTGSSTPAGGALMWAAHRTLNGEDHFVLGVVLHENAGTTAEAGLTSVLLVSRRLVEAMD
ncbi:D-alanyl-D-alanine carboxypeptidase family protein [Catenulispora pinisilvae]|uniref:D-alanyl-D-alanine carboxypeptidase family protein n=1 Tax=Catenulispora pinisilvae TaxID=2705253 RepID=UPI002B265ACC|nr:D-alanyl-D-alanine carboxypeptidase [Catenulispora pinisilvae]